MMKSSCCGNKMKHDCVICMAHLLLQIISETNFVKLTVQEKLMSHVFVQSDAGQVHIDVPVKERTIVQPSVNVCLKLIYIVYASVYNTSQRDFRFQSSL